MKKRVIRLTESDLEKLVQRIIKEEDEMDPNAPEEGGEENDDNPQDVKNFLEAMKKFFLNKYPRYASKINTRKEKALLLAALAEELQVDLSMLQMAKSELKKMDIGQ